MKEKEEKVEKPNLQNLQKLVDDFRDNLKEIMPYYYDLRITMLPIGYYKWLDEYVETINQDTLIEVDKETKKWWKRIEKDPNPKVYLEKLMNNQVSYYYLGNLTLTVK